LTFDALLEAWLMVELVEAVRGVDF
jgi:hypothetical protein